MEADQLLWILVASGCALSCSSGGQVVFQMRIAAPDRHSFDPLADQVYESNAHRSKCDGNLRSVEFESVAVICQV